MAGYTAIVVHFPIPGSFKVGLSSLLDRALPSVDIPQVVIFAHSLATLMNWNIQVHPSNSFIFDEPVSRYSSVLLAVIIRYGVTGAHGRDTAQRPDVIRHRCSRIEGCTSIYGLHSNCAALDSEAKRCHDWRTRQSYFTAHSVASSLLPL